MSTMITVIVAELAEVGRTTSTRCVRNACHGLVLNIIWLLPNLVEASFDLFRYQLLNDQLKPWELHPLVSYTIKHAAIRAVKFIHKTFCPLSLWKPTIGYCSTFTWPQRCCGFLYHPKSIGST